MPQRQNLSEAREQLLVEATGTPGRFRVQLINPGWGSSGYYSPEVLAEAARERVFGAGLHMYADHPRGDGSGTDANGNRSVTDLWAVLESDATLDDSGALIAEARVFAPYRELVADMRDDIGLSIRALGSFELGEAEGRRGQLITSIDEATSVDFVTAAGRGGRILEMVESAGGVTSETAQAQLLEARNVGQWIESRLHLTLTQIADDMFGDGRLTREERISLSSAVGDALTAFVASLEASQPQLYERDLWADPAQLLASEAARRRLDETSANDLRDALSTAVSELYRIPDTQWAWVRDFDPDANVVTFDISGQGENNGTFQQPYTVAADGSCELTDARTEVAVRTVYVPVDPAGQPNPQESEEDTMPQIEEAQLRQLEEAAGRVQTLESERDAANQRATNAERQLAEATARQAARPVVAEILADAQLPPSTITRVTESIVAAAPLTDTGALDEAALRTATTAARTTAEAEIAEAFKAAGAGTVRGFGASQTTEVNESDLDKRSAGVFGRKVS